MHGLWMFCLLYFHYYYYYYLNEIMRSQGLLEWCNNLSALITSFRLRGLPSELRGMGYMTGLRFLRIGFLGLFGL